MTRPKRFLVDLAATRKTIVVSSARNLVMSMEKTGSTQGAFVLTAIPLTGAFEILSVSGKMYSESCV